MMANIDVMITQPVTHEWQTPIDFFRTLDAEFHFDLDSAATDANALCPMYITEVEDGLKAGWHLLGTVFCNPPYGTEIGKWVAKGFSEAQLGTTVVMLIPARTDTAYWHEYVMKASEIRLVRGRLRFSGATTNAPFPNAVVVFRPGSHVPVVTAIERDGSSTCVPSDAAGRRRDD